MATPLLDTETYVRILETVVVAIGAVEDTEGGASEAVPNDSGEEGAGRGGAEAGESAGEAAEGGEVGYSVADIGRRLKAFVDDAREQKRRLEVEKQEDGHSFAFLHAPSPPQAHVTRTGP